MKIFDPSIATLVSQARVVLSDLLEVLQRFNQIVDLQGTSFGRFLGEGY